jgi:hypothetical protein
MDFQRENLMQPIDGGARRKAILGTLLLGLIVADSCDCRSRPPGPLAPTAAVAPHWPGAARPQPAPSLHDLPASHDRPAYGLPLVIQFDHVPEVPDRVKGPTTEGAKTRD